jgi:predicted transcriptional regulator
MDTSRTVLTAEHVMQRTVFVLRPETPVLDAVEELLQKGFSGAPVVEGGKVVGVFGERQALTAIADALYEGKPIGTVADHMRRDFDVVGATTDLREVVAVFRDQLIRRLPVVDRERHLLGVVSRGDALNGLRQLYARQQKKKFDKAPKSLRHGASS